MIPIEQFWEVLLTKLRGTQISDAAKNKRDIIQRENKLIKDLETLNHQIILDMTDKYIGKGINKKNRELEELRDIKLKGAFIRSRSLMFAQDEKPNKIFLNLENNKFVSKNIKGLKTVNNIKITEPSEILEEMRTFYQNLYSHKHIDKIEESMFYRYH